MFNRRRTPLLVAAACLVMASAAAAAPGDTFTAHATPSHVKPNTFAQYTITVTNASSSPSEADRATIAPPAGFTIAAPPGDPAVSGCDTPRDWDAELLADGSIRLARNDGPTNNLCPGGTLSVQFNATSSGETTNPAEWTVALFAEDVPFTLDGSQPTVTVDGTAPETTITSGPSAITNQTNAEFAFSSEAGSTFACRLDSSAFEPCKSPKGYLNLNEGPHTFVVRATDPAGNTELNPATWIWTIDVTPPTVAITGRPGDESTTRSATFSFSASEPQTQCRLDSRPFATCASPVTFNGLSDGPHTFVVAATDAAGNTAQDTDNWTIDATAPETTLGSRPRSRTTRLSATFTFTASEAATFQCRLDSAPFSSCTSPKAYPRLRRSAHTFQVRAIDAAGNVDSTPAVHRWTIAAAARQATASSALFAPRSGARVTAPPLLRWRRVTGASYYNVQLYRGRVKVLSTWPKGTRLQLRARWTYLGQEQRLTPGRYQWYVWPGYGRPTARKYGRLLGQSTFTVIARR